MPKRNFAFFFFFPHAHILFFFALRPPAAKGCSRGISTIWPNAHGAKRGEFAAPFPLPRWAVGLLCLFLEHRDSFARCVILIQATDQSKQHAGISMHVVVHEKDVFIFRQWIRSMASSSHSFEEKKIYRPLRRGHMFLFRPLLPRAKYFFVSVCKTKSAKERKEMDVCAISFARQRFFLAKFAQKSTGPPPLSQDCPLINIHFTASLVLLLLLLLLLLPLPSLHRRQRNH